MAVNLILGLAVKPAAAGEKITYSSASTVITTAAPIGTNAFRIVATTDVHVDVGPSPVAAVTSGKFIPAGIPEFHQANMGDKVAVIRASADGTVYVTPVIVGAA